MWPGFEFLKLPDGKLTHSDDRPGADPLRNEAYALLRCDRKGKDGKPRNPMACFNNNGDFVLRLPNDLGQIISKPDGNVTFLHTNGSAVERNKESQITSVSYPDGKRREFAYGMDGSLVTVKDMDGSTWRKDVSVGHVNLWTHERVDGRPASTGFADLQIDHSGDFVVVQKDSRKIFRHDGHVILSADGASIEWDEKGQRIRDTNLYGFREYQYDDRGFIETVKDVKHVRSVKQGDGWYEYDTFGRKVAGPLPDSYFAYRLDDGSLDCPAKFRDVNGNPEWTVEYVDKNTAKRRYRLGWLETYKFDDTGKLLERERWEDTIYKLDHYVWQVYDAEGNGPIDTLMFQKLGLDWLGVPKGSKPAATR